MPLGGDEGRDGEEEGKQSKCGGGGKVENTAFSTDWEDGEVITGCFEPLKFYASSILPGKA